tara:strand:- start:204132 stop:205106 length:975 start_codon:yes stop_codon:yes gene_type:complete
MRVLVTGANGLLATNTIKKLLEQDYEVVGLLRDTNKFVLPAHPKLDLITGDIRDQKAVNNAVKSCDIVIHAAALTAPDLLKYEQYYKVNVLGTQNLVEAAILNNIQKFIYVSSANTIGHGTKTSPGTEKIGVKEPFIGSFYAKSKLEGEEIVLASADKIHSVIVNPTFMLGAYDAKPSSGKIILMGYNKRIVFVPPGGKNFVNVDDVAEAIISAFAKAKSGEKYLLSGENLSYWEFFKKLNQFSEKKPALVKVPKFLLLSAGFAGNFIRKMGIATPVSLSNMRILSITNYYSNKKAERELGIHFKPIEIGINQAIDWFNKNGRI